MNDLLMQAVLEALLFFMLASDEDINPDVAIEQAETLSFILNRMTPHDKRTLVSYARSLAAAEQGGSANAARIERLLNIGEELRFLEGDEKVDSAV